MIWTINLDGQEIYNRWSIQAHSQSPIAESNKYTGQKCFDNTVITTHLAAGLTRPAHTRETMNTLRTQPIARNFLTIDTDQWGNKQYSEAIRFEGTVQEVIALVNSTMRTVQDWTWK